MCLSDACICIQNTHIYACFVRISMRVLYTYICVFCTHIYMRVLYAYKYDKNIIKISSKYCFDILAAFDLLE